MGIGLLQPGCNCLLKFEATSACSGLLTWCSAGNGKTLVQRKATLGVTWDTVATIAAGSPAVYAVNYTQNGWIYRVVCESCPGKGAISNEVTVVLCTFHSSWWRLHKQNFSNGGTLYHGCNYESGAGFSGLRRINNPTGAFSFWANPGPNPPDPGFPATIYYSWGCSNPSPGTAGTAHFLSMVQSSTDSRSGYTFDWQYIVNNSAPNGCGAYFSMHNIFARGLHPLGHVQYSVAYNWSFTEVAKRPVVFQNSGLQWGPYTDLIPSSGLNWSWQSLQTYDMDVDMWLPPSNLWPDGSASPQLIDDPIGNCVGIISKNQVNSYTASGSIPCGSPPGQLNWSVPNRMVIQSIGHTQAKIRTCAQAQAGTDTLPPSLTNNDPCPYMPYSTQGICIP